MDSGSPIIGGNNTSADGFINMIGAINAFDSFEGWKPVGTESIIEAAPDFILISNRGAHSYKNLENMHNHPTVKYTPAAMNNNIIALDGMNKNNVLNLLEKIPEIIWVKVGLELFVSEGPDVLSILRDKGKKIFLDLKFHDIPSTVARACFSASQTGAEFISLHTCAGIKALNMAKEAANEGAAKANLVPPKLLGITI